MKHLLLIVAITVTSVVTLPTAGLAENFQKVGQSTTGSSFYVDIDSIKRDYIGNVAFMSYEVAPGRDPQPRFVQGNCNLKTAGVNGSNRQIVMPGTVISKLLNYVCVLSE